MDNELYNELDDETTINYYDEYIKSLGYTERDEEIIKLSEGRLIIKTVFADENGFVWDLYDRRDEWEYIDTLVNLYQRRYSDEPMTEEEQINSDDAGVMLIEKFQPLFRKYVIILTTGQINFKNMEQKQFVRLFVNTPCLLAALNKQKISREYREAISQKFNFIFESYGQLTEDEIMSDLQILFLTLVKRYKPVGKSFCCYVFNSFKYEVARHIKAFLKDPSNFHYKTTELDETEIRNWDTGYEMIEDDPHETPTGSPDLTWIMGETCSPIFCQFTPTERTIFIKYYLEDWNDGQIADMLGCHINTANQKRKMIAKMLADAYDIDHKYIVRHRKSGRKALSVDGAPISNKWKKRKKSI